jgi:hypothetical protein
MQYLLAAVIGLFGGLTSGLFGVGGGIVMVPAMVWMLHTNIKTAIGTSLAVIIPTAMTGVLKHQQLGNIDWRMAGSLVPVGYCGRLLRRGAHQTHPGGCPQTLLRRLHDAGRLKAALFQRITFEL